MHESKITQIKSSLGDIIRTHTVRDASGLIHEHIEIHCPTNFIREKKKFNDFKWGTELK